MQGIHNVSRIQQNTQRPPQESLGKQVRYSCALCGSERYRLVLTAEALNDRVGLIFRCGNCNASQEVNEGIQIPSYT
jgi:predicted SprT family Zn-dependent metalloprotease